MNRESLRQALRVHVQRLRMQHMRSQSDGSVSSSNPIAVGCTVDELVHQVEGALSTDKPDYGFAEALARLQMILGVSSGNNSTSSNSNGPVTHRRGSLGGSGRRGSISDMLDMIDAEAMVSRHSLKSIA